MHGVLYELHPHLLVWTHGLCRSANQIYYANMLTESYWRIPKLNDWESET